MVRSRTNGRLDLGSFPLEPILRQAVDPDPERAGEAWKFLGTMANHDRPEAAVFLLGLLRIHGGDLSRMTVLVRAISMWRTEAAAEALKDEFHRVPSTPATRSYLNLVLETLIRFPYPISQKMLERLADDQSLSVRWRRRFVEAAGRDF